MGWTDVSLVEKTELTAGTTWHSTGLTALVVDSFAVSKLNALSLSLFSTLEAETGQPVGLRKPGAMRLAKNRGKLAKYVLDSAKARVLGIDFEVIGPKDVKRLFPLLVLDGIRGASYAPEEGYIDAAMATQAFAKGARDGGAKIYRQTRVTGLEQSRAGDWRVTTDKGTVDAEIVVNATGFWAPEIAAMAGVSLPIIAMERQYLVTDTVPEIKARDVELPVVRDDDWPFYFKQEGDGFLFGVHEAGTPFCFEDGIPPDFGQELLPPDLDRGSKHIQAGMNRVPVFAKVGVKSVVCGPTSRTPDLNGLMGPISGLRNFYVLAGFSSGVTQGAGAGQQLAEWIIAGEPQPRFARTRRQPLRGLRQPALCACHAGRKAFRRHHRPDGGTPGRPARQDRSPLSPPQGPGGRVRSALWLGMPALVQAEGPPEGDPGGLGPAPLVQTRRPGMPGCAPARRHPWTDAGSACSRFPDPAPSPSSTACAPTRCRNARARRRRVRC